MSAKNKENKFLKQNYEDILRNCQESLEKYKLSSRPISARTFSIPNTQRKENSRERGPWGCHASEECSRADFELHEECIRRLECSKWIDELPPIWDEFLEKDYVEYVVHELLEDKVESCSTSSGTSPDTRRIEGKTEPKKKDQAVLVRDSDLNDDVQAFWKPVGDVASISPPKKSSQPKEVGPKKLASPGRVVNKGKILTSVKKPPTPAKANVKGRVVSSVTKPPPPPTTRTLQFKTRPKSSPPSALKKPQTPQSQRKSPVQTKLSPYSRFVGKPRKVPIDFSAEHPGLVLEDTFNGTSFPCRLDKSDQLKDAGDEKLNASSEVAPIDSEESFRRSTTEEQDEIQSSGKISWGYSDKTWQEVLMERPNKASGRGILRYGGLEKVSSPSEKELSGRDVIYDSSRIIRPSERATASKLMVQKLPVLCIRGECKVQKTVEISIDGAGAEGPREDRTNVRFFEYSHRAEVSPKSTKAVKNTKNIEIQTVGEENEKESGMVKERLHQEDVGGIIEALPKYELSGKTTNRFLAPFLRADLNEYKIAATQKTPKPPTSSQEPTGHSTAETSQLSAVNDSSDLSTQTDDEKLRKGSCLKSSSTSSSYTNPTTSDEFQSNQPKESVGTIPSSSGGVSHFFTDENIQLKLNDTGEVQNILKEVFSGSEDGEDNDARPRGDGHKGTATVGIDCSDLMTGIEISVQTEDIMGNYSMGPGKELTNSADRDKTVDQIFERICRDETDAFRKFKLRTAPNPAIPQGGINTPTGRIDFNVTNANDLAIDDRLAGMVLGEAIKANSGGAASKRPISGTTQLYIPPPFELPIDRIARLGNATEFRADNYTDNLRAIKGDEVEERSHQADEVSSSSCLGSHVNLSGRKCYCRRHRRTDDERGGGRKGREFAYEPVLSPLRDLYDANLRLNSPLMQSNYDEPSERRSWRDRSHKDFQKRVLETNPRFSRTLGKIYDAAPNVTARPSNRMDPEVQRAVKKFLESLLEPQPPLSNRKGRYTKLNNNALPPPPPAGHPLSGLTSKGWTSTTTSSTSTSSQEHRSHLDHRTFASLWMSNCDSNLSETESSDLQRMLYAPLWNDLPIKYNLRSSTGSSRSSVEAGPNKLPHPSRGAPTKQHARDISDGEVLSLGEVRSLDS